MITQYDHKKLELYLSNLAEQTKIYQNPVDTTSIKKAIMDKKEMRILPYSEWMKFSRDEIRMLLHQTATYVAPTEELIDYLDNLIGQEKTIEVGAGNGFIGRELNIPMTDSHQQQDPKVKAYYEFMKQPVIKYPADVMKMDAATAVRRFKPHTVIGCYITHKWREDTQDGNDKGIDMYDTFNHCQRLVMVGNLYTHRNNPLMQVHHQEIELPGLLTRSVDDSTNRIFIWQH